MINGIIVAAILSSTSNAAINTTETVFSNQGLHTSNQKAKVVSGHIKYSETSTQLASSPYIK
ncbi:hypothetical protein AB4160_11295, partial [Shewanella sp. 10N.286.51.B8]|uniref:hypothetical protein n=1 Tax=Shewanella sp. 10N.286.51.B8 TaxID=3229708 RepID=UPI00354C4802